MGNLYRKMQYFLKVESMVAILKNGRHLEFFSMLTGFIRRAISKQFVCDNCGASVQK